MCQYQWLYVCQEWPLNTINQSSRLLEGEEVWWEDVKRYQAVSRFRFWVLLVGLFQGGCSRVFCPQGAVGEMLPLVLQSAVKENVGVQCFRQRFLIASLVAMKRGVSLIPFPPSSVDYTVINKTFFTLPPQHVSAAASGTKGISSH